MASRDLKMSKQGTVSKRKHIILMISLKPGMIWRPKSSYSQSVMASYNIGLSTFYDLKKQKDHLRLFVALSESVKGLFKQQALRQGKVSFE